MNDWRQMPFGLAKLRQDALHAVKTEVDDLGMQRQKPGQDGVSCSQDQPSATTSAVEAISRGAVFCLFVETEAAARGCIRDNIEAFQLFGNTRIHRRSATDLGPKPAGLGAPFDLAFLDPPYRHGLVPLALEQLASGQWLSPGAIVMAETGSDEAELTAPGWEIIDTRIYGAARVSFLRRA